MPQIQPIIDTVLDTEERTEMFSFAPEKEELTEEDLIAWEAQMRASMTPEDWAKWGVREGESDIEHARRCSGQIWGDRHTAEAALVQAIHDQDEEAVNRLLDEVTK